MKYVLPIFLFLSLANQTFAQLPQQDCIDAISLCNGRNEFPYNYDGFGESEELLTSPGLCLITGENNTSWYRMEFNTSGQLVFSIIPYSTIDDYDFALFDLTTQSCADIPTGDAPSVRCNFAVTPGVATGIGVGGTGVSQGPNGTDFLLPMSVDSGDVLYLVVDNFTSNGQGFIIDFNGTTANMVNNNSLTVGIGRLSVVSDTVKVALTFNQPVNCSSISNDFSEFVVIDNKGNTLDIVSVECDSAAVVLVIIAIKPATTVSISSVEVQIQGGLDGNTIVASCNASEVNAGTINVIAGLNTIDIKGSVNLYPNPAQGEVTITAPYAMEQIAILDLNGKVLLTETTAATQHTLTTTGLDNGIYLLRITTLKGSAIKKLVVAH